MSHLPCHPPNLTVPLAALPAPAVRIFTQACAQRAVTALGCLPGPSPAWLRRVVLADALASAFPPEQEVPETIRYALFHRVHGFSHSDEDRAVLKATQAVAWAIHPAGGHQLYIHARIVAAATRCTLLAVTRPGAQLAAYRAECDRQRIHLWALRGEEGS